MYLKPIPSSAPPAQTISELPEGKLSAIETLRQMRTLIRDGRKSSHVRQQAEALTRALPSKAYAKEARECFEFVRDDIRYLRDPNTIERIQLPEVTLQTRLGDCDDKVVLLCSLLESIGHPTRLVAVGLYGSPLRHVYCETRIGSRWVACETTEPWEFGRAASVGVTSRYQLDI